MLHTAVTPKPVATPRLIVLNRPLASWLGLEVDRLEAGDAAAMLSGHSLPPGAAPLAQAYAGHQFGHFTALGDGRAILLGEQVTPHGERMDIQLKGSGRTPYSRRGDGLAALGPMLREYIISEAMHALGIPTTRSLAVVATGVAVSREELLPGAVLTRVAASHLRVGTFQWAAAHRDASALSALINYTIQRHYPEIAGSGNPARVLLEAVIERQAALLARWMLVGFVHGVMNTDNMALSGETIDYGPCAFMDAYDPATVFSSIDTHGRYAFANQPAIAQWNLARFAETMLPLIDSNEERAIASAAESLEHFDTLYQEHWLSGMRRKLGLFTQETGDRQLVEELLASMQEAKADFTNTFADLNLGKSEEGLPRSRTESFNAWHRRWADRLARQPQSHLESETLRRANNPAIIPRNHQVEAALAAAVEDDDPSVMERFLDALRSPFDHDRAAKFPEYREPAPPSTLPYRTFCGT